MKYLICFALLFAVVQAYPGLVAPLTYSVLPTVATYGAAPHAAYSAYPAPSVAAYSQLAAPAVYSAPVARVASVAPVAYTAPLVSTLWKK